MSAAGRFEWDDRHHGQRPGHPESFVIEMLPRLPRGLALDVAAGRGRHSLMLARAGMRVIAVDHSRVGLAILASLARREDLAVSPVVADMTEFPLREERFDVIVNINFLERELFPKFKRALKVGGALLFGTFLIDEAANHRHKPNPRYFLEHGELRRLLEGLDVVEYREGLNPYGDPGAEPPMKHAWRAAALAFRRE
ncbi:MAG: class I SAM-dependent methyltransferase [Candidatus Binataceae bacterium]|jgi:SAM-dependent methyltransferase